MFQIKLQTKLHPTHDQKDHNPSFQSDASSGQVTQILPEAPRLQTCYLLPDLQTAA